MEDSLHKNITTSPRFELPQKILQRTLVKLESESFFIATAALGATRQAPFQPLLFYPNDCSKQKSISEQAQSFPVHYLPLLQGSVLPTDGLPSQGPTAPGPSAPRSSRVRAPRQPRLGLQRSGPGAPGAPRAGPGALPPPQSALPGPAPGRCPRRAAHLMLDRHRGKPVLLLPRRSLSHCGGPAGRARSLTGAKRNREAGNACRDCARSGTRAAARPRAEQRGHCQHMSGASTARPGRSPGPIPPGRAGPPGPGRSPRAGPLGPGRAGPPGRFPSAAAPRFPQPRSLHDVRPAPGHSGARLAAQPPHNTSLSRGKVCWQSLLWPVNSPNTSVCPRDPYVTE